MGAAYAALPELGLRAGMTRRKTPSFYKEYFHAQQHDADEDHQDC